jgi:5'(3')-deoxyribonucleotidase
VELYDKDFWKYKNYKKIHWTEINTYDFKELTLINQNIVLDYFDDHRFFINLEYMENAKEVLDELKDEYEINICSLGRKRNLYLKEEWISKNIPYANFMGVNLDQGNKSNIDMSGGIALDDHIGMLYSNNADIKIIYGDVYNWNKNNIYNYPRCYNWYEFRKYLYNNHL